MSTAAKVTHVQKRAASAAFDPESLGFWLGLRLSPNKSPREERQLQRNLEDLLLDRGLRVLGGTQLHLFVEAQDREISLTDQVDLIDWCLLQGMASEIAVSDLTGEGNMPARVTSVLCVASWDLATIGVGLLYRIGRIKPQQYVELLGGFQPNPSGKLFK